MDLYGGCVTRPAITRSASTGMFAAELPGAKHIPARSFHFAGTAPATPASSSLSTASTSTSKLTGSWRLRFWVNPAGLAQRLLTATATRPITTTQTFLGKHIKKTSRTSRLTEPLLLAKETAPQNLPRTACVTSGQGARTGSLWRPLVMSSASLFRPSQKSLTESRGGTAHDCD